MIRNAVQDVRDVFKCSHVGILGGTVGPLFHKAHQTAQRLGKPSSEVVIRHVEEANDVDAGASVCDSRCVMPVLDSALQPTWDELWAVARSAADDIGEDPRYVFEPVGLIVQPPGSALPLSYDATPADAITFASTGGDGVHFSASVGACGPCIVMTVPMQFDQPNIVVGEDMREFLSLGCTNGYFRLEQLAYDLPTAALAPSSEQANDERLALLRGSLGLSPWPSIQPRLEELQQQLVRP